MAIANYNQKRGINTFALRYYDFRRKNQKEERKQMLKVLKNKSDLSDIFVIMRGVMHLTGKDIDHTGGGQRLKEDYKPFLQNIVTTLGNAGKHVYIVGENPVFPYLPRALIRRPFFNLAPEPQPMIKQDVYKHQKEYLEMLSSIQGAEIINGIDAFCQGDECSMISKDGVLLYTDRNHLSSTHGGSYLVENILEPYLSAIAEREKGQ